MNTMVQQQQQQCLLLRLLLLLQLLVAVTEGCSCPLRHPQQHFCEADFVANVKVRRVVTLPDGQSVLKVRVRRLLKSTQKATAALSKRLIYTIPGTCSLNVTSRSMHVITGDIQAGKPWTSACHFAAPWSSLAPKMKKGFRLLYQRGCDCPIMSCHWWDRSCPSAAFFCSWRTSIGTNDCQARHGVCLRKATGGCGWLGGRKYRGCMKKWRDQRRRNLSSVHSSVPSSGRPSSGRISLGSVPVRANIATLIPTAKGGTRPSAEENIASNSILSNDVVDGVRIVNNRKHTNIPTGRRVAPPPLGADTTYSFGPRVVSASRFQKPRKPRPGHHANLVYTNRIGKPKKYTTSSRTSGSNGARTISWITSTKSNRSSQTSTEINTLSPAPATSKPMLTNIERDFVFDNHIGSAYVSLNGDNEDDIVLMTNENAHSDSNSDWDPRLELAGAYHRRRYPEYTTRIGYIPDN